MLTTPSPLRSDPRVMAGLIAKTSLRLIDKQVEDSSRRVFEATLLRLLDIYEHDAFRHRTRRSILARARSPDPELRKEPDHTGDVRSAIAAAHKAMLPQLDRAEFCGEIAKDVRACFRGSVPTSENLTKHKARLRRFLTLVQDQLPH